EHTPALLDAAQRLLLLDVVALDQPLDPAPGHAENAVVASFHPVAVVGAGAVYAVLGERLALLRRHLDLLGHAAGDHAGKRLEALSGGSRCHDHLEVDPLRPLRLRRLSL